MAKKRMTTGRQIARLVRLAVRLTFAQLQERWGWLERLTDPKFNLVLLKL